MQNNLPPHLHIFRGGKRASVVEQDKKRIPQANWLNNPEAWNPEKFIDETAEFLYQTYGINAEIDRHLLAMLATEMGLYIQCSAEMKKSGLLQVYNNGVTTGPSVHFGIAEKTIGNILRLMKELCLLPRGRPGNGKPTSKEMLKFLAGPNASSLGEV